MAEPPKGWLTRNEAADLLRVSNNTIAEWQRHELVRPVLARSRHGNCEAYYYDPDELRRVPRRANRFVGPHSPGEIAARVFELLRDGRTIAEVVIEVRVEPSVVEDLREQWMESNGRSLVVPERERDELERLLGGEAKNAAELVRLVGEQVSK